MKTFAEYLSEASLGRFWQHFQNNEPIAVLSGDRNENTKAENKANFNFIKRHVSLAGFGYNKVKGGYVEEGGKKVADESSVVIYAPKDREKELFDLAMSLGKKFKQSSIMFINTNGEVNWISCRNDSFLGEIGKKKRLGKFKTNQIEDFFTKIGNKEFKFDKFEEPAKYIPSLSERQLSKWYKEKLIKVGEQIVEVWEQSLSD